LSLLANVNGLLANPNGLPANPNGPLAIVHTESSLGWGGQEIRTLSESQGLIRRGHAVRLLAPAAARIAAEAPRFGVPLEILPIEKKRPRGLRALRQWLRANRCDVVNTHSSTDSWLASLALLTLGSPVPVVRTRHVSAPVSKNAASRWLYTRAASCVVTTGDAIRRQLIDDNGFPAERIESVPTGIDAGLFAPGDRAAARALLDLPPEKFLVGIVATLRSWKGHRYLVDAMARLPEGVELVIVGDGPQRAALEAQIRELGLGARVRMTGNRDDVVPWLHALDVFALPSYANEGVPQALVQAMLSGLACVTTTAGSIPELALHEQTALVVPAQDPAALAAAITRLAEDAALRGQLGRRAREHCAGRYGLERMLDRMEAIFRSVAGRSLIGAE
jgi:glycosyltransferase involved in cell wall biosynthesis